MDSLTTFFSPFFGRDALMAPNKITVEEEESIGLQLYESLFFALFNAFSSVLLITPVSAVGIQQPSHTLLFLIEPSMPFFS